RRQAHAGRGAGRSGGRCPVDTAFRVEAAAVRWLLRSRLAPAGLVVDASPATSHVGENAGAAHVASPTPLLAIRQRLPLLPYRVTGPVTARLQLLYAPPVVAAVVIAAAAVTLRLYLGPELRSGFPTLLMRPELVLFLLVLDVPLRLW